MVCLRDRFVRLRGVSGWRVGLCAVVCGLLLMAGCSGGSSSEGEDGGGSSGGGEGVVVGESGIGVVSGGESEGGVVGGGGEVVGFLDVSGCSDGSWLEDASAGAVSDCEALVGLRNRVAGGRVGSEVPSVFDGVDGDEFWVWGNSGVDRWRGVELDEDGRVVRLELWLGDELEAVPEEVVELSELRDLILSAGGVSGSLPLGFGGLSKLEKLFFDRSSFTEIPSEVFELVNLRDFRVGGEIGRIPVEIGGLVELRVLDLADNRLRGSIPVEIGGLVNLERLDLSTDSYYDGDNQLTGPIPSEIGNLTRLDYLNLSGNRLSGEIPAELGGLGELEVLRLFGNRLSGQIPVELGNLGSLVDLDLNDNLLEGSIPSALGNLVSLKGLSLSRNRLVGRIPSELENLVLEGEEGGLEWLTVWENDLCGEIPERLFRIDNFTFWDNPRLRGPCDDIESVEVP